MTGYAQGAILHVTGKCIESGYEGDLVDILSALSVLVGIIAILLVLGLGAAAAGVDSRPGFSEDQGHHNSFGRDF